MLDTNFESYYWMKKLINQAIEARNNLIPHLSIGFLTPNRTHLQNEIIIKTWKKKNSYQFKDTSSLYLK